MPNSYWRRSTRPSESHGPTSRQLRYIADLGGDVEYAKKLATWQMASDYIDELKKNPPKSGSVRPHLATSRQLDYIESLGGDRAKAATLSVEQASALIRELRAKPKAASVSGSSGPVPNQAAPQPMKRSADPRLDLLNGLIGGVRDGYFAVRADESDPITFIRISRPTKGQLAGCVKVQTQHSDVLKDAAVYYEMRGVWSVYSPSIIERLFLLCVDPIEAGRLYAKELNHCWRCNKPLTDGRSRHYGIGPDCEKIWPEVIDRIDELHDGHSFEWLHARSML